MHLPRSFPILLLTAVIVACAPAKPLTTPAEIATADATGNLPALYNQVKSQLANKDRGDKKYAEQFAQLDKIGLTLTNRLDDDLRKRMESARLHNSIVPLNVLTEVRDEAEDMRAWQPARYDALLREIAKNRAVTEKAIASLNTYMGGLAPTAFRKKFDALTQLAQVTGDKKYAEERDATIRSLRVEFEQARATENYERALQLLDALPEDAQTTPTRLELQAQLSEHRFNDAVAEDRPDEAYRYFDALSKLPRFDVVKVRITANANDLAAYFVALAADAVTAGRMSDAYRWFTQARDVHMKLDGRVNAVPEERVFVDRLYRGHDRAKTEGLWGLALGHLLVVQEFDPARPNLAADLRTANEEVSKIAIRSATVAPFASASGNADYSGAVATQITGYLFKAVPNDVRIIGWDPTRGSSGIDYTVSGSIDEARVETSQNTTRKTERVITEKNALTRNPRYDEWLKMTPREQKRNPQPAPQLAADRKEDVSYNLIQVRKVGYFSVGFRIQEASTGRVVYTDTLTIKKELEAEGNEGVSLGIYTLPAKSPALPTDSEMLNKLSLEASEEIGKRLAARVGDLEKRYAEAGKKSASANNPLEAAQYYAEAVVVAQRKSIDAAPYALELKRQSAASGYAR